jgi:GNAT superfamily N-acetyltransferase
MNIIIRLAVATDAVTISKLSAQLGYSVTVEKATEQIVAVSNSANDAAFIAILNDEIVGWVHVFHTIRLESNSFCEIGGLVIDSKHRGKGIGKALIEQAKKWTTGKDVHTLKVRSNVVREEASKFYIQLGFKTIKQQQVFEIDI